MICGKNDEGVDGKVEIIPPSYVHLILKFEVLFFSNQSSP